MDAFVYLVIFGVFLYLYLKRNIECVHELLLAVYCLYHYFFKKKQIIYKIVQFQY